MGLRVLANFLWGVRGSKWVEKVALDTSLQGALIEIVSSANNVPHVPQYSTDLPLLPADGVIDVK